MNANHMVEGAGIPAIQASHIIAITARLTELLAEEIDLLTSMRIGDLAPLQEEKIQLAEVLEAVKRYIAHNPSVLDEFTVEEREDLVALSDVFQTVLQENWQRLTVARSVNEMVRQSIADTLGEMNPLAMYGVSGTSDGGADGLPPVSIDEKI